LEDSSSEIDPSASAVSIALAAFNKLEKEAASFGSIEAI
jgi:hypothetical protein